MVVKVALPPLAVDPAYDSSDNNGATHASAPTVADDGAIAEHGRTYHSFKQGAYFLPNDVEEQGRLNLQHELIMGLLDDQLGLAPPVTAAASPNNVLDVATGTGIWAREFARRHPASYVVGSDLSLIQPLDGGVANCRFVQGDSENEDWPFGDVLFDYIHLRFMVTCFSDANNVIRRIFKQLAPGGWVEFQDTMGEPQKADGTVFAEGESAFSDFCHSFIRGTTKLGKDPTWIGRLEELLTAHGFVDVHVRTLPNPMGSWPMDPKYKRIGALGTKNLDLALDTAIKLVLADGKTEEEAKNLAGRVRAELAEGKTHAVVPFYVVYARKPE